MIEFEDFSGTLPYEFIASLIEGYGIPPENAKSFESSLNSICGLFLQRRVTQESLGTVSEQHAEFQRVINEATKFATFLGTVTKPIEEYLEGKSYELNEDDHDTECMLYETNNTHFDPDEEKRSTYPHYSTSFLDFRTLQRQSNFLASAARYIRQLDLGQQKTGPQVDRNLDYWIEDMRSLWAITLGKQFTRDEHNGVATSEAARFCVEVFSAISPETPHQKVLNAMKKRIKLDREFLAGRVGR